MFPRFSLLWWELGTPLGSLWNKHAHAQLNATWWLLTTETWAACFQVPSQFFCHLWYGTVGESGTVLDMCDSHPLTSSVLAVSFYRPSTCNFLFFLLFWALTHSSSFYRPSTRESIIITRLSHTSVLQLLGSLKQKQAFKSHNLSTHLTGCVHSSILTFHVMVWEWDNGHTHSNNRLL